MDALWTPWRYAYITGRDTQEARQMPRDGVPPALAPWFKGQPGGSGCVFCNMQSAIRDAVEHGMKQEEADQAAWILFRGDNNFLVLNAFPYTSGHLMIVPYEHQSSLAALPAPAAAEMMQLARKAERALREVYSPDGLNLGMNLGEAAGAGVAHHLHLHALPRWTGDTNFMTVVSETRVLPEMLRDTWRRLHAALAAGPVAPSND